MAARIPTTLPEIEWEEDRKGNGKHFEFPWGQFRIKLSQTYDNDMGPDDLGEGVGQHNAKPGDIRRHSIGWREYEYFRPTQTAETYYKDLATSATNDAEIVAAMAEASKYVHQDYKRWEDYNHNEWCYTDVAAAIYYQEVELASSVVGGVESDSKGYEDECAWEQLGEAIDEALASLKRLRMLVNGASLKKLEALLGAKSQAAYDAQRAKHAELYPDGHYENQAVRVERQPIAIPDYIPQQDDEYRECEICRKEITTLRTDVPRTQRVCKDCLEDQIDCPFCRSVRIQTDDTACQRCYPMIPFADYMFTWDAFSTAEDKALVANQLACLILSGFDKVYWSSKLYDGLYIHMFGHIAHYNQEGFWNTWFVDTSSQMQFIRNMLTCPYAGSGSWGDVEKALRTWVLRQIAKHDGSAKRQITQFLNELPQLEEKTA